MEYTAIDATGYGKEGSEPLSLMTHVNLDALLPESRPSEAGVVSWSPPAPNWNPWTGANIDEGKHTAYEKINMSKKCGGLGPTTSGSRQKF